MTVNRARLSLTELGEFDDVLTDALVDKVYYWTRIRKTKRLYLPNRKIRESEITPIVSEHVIRGRNVTAAVEKFGQLSWVQAFLQGVEERKRHEFIKHVRRYIQVYHPEAPFEVNSTSRYTLTTQEACVNARRSLHAGETIRFLSGCMLLLTDEEEATLDDNSDFSVICTSRMKGTSVLLGPARFVNHDCNPNCKFITTNKDNITLMVLREIPTGEELTIKYSENYFGDNNCECLCQTCETGAQNGFAPARKLDDPTHNLNSAMADGVMYSFRPSRHASQWSSRTPSNFSRPVSTLQGQGTVLKSELPSRKRGPIGLNSVVTPPRSDGAPTSDDELQQEHQILDLTPPPEGPLQSRDALTFGGPLMNMDYSPQNPDPNDPDSDSDLSEIGEEEYQQLLERFSPQLSLRYKNKRKRSVEGVQSQGSCAKRAKPTSCNNQEHLSELALQKSKRKCDTDVVHPTQKRVKHAAPNPSNLEIRRFPGDSAHVPKVGLKCECTDCGQQFWNIETWYVPRSCKRCERHSKLYGLGWPKTFKRKNDQEPQIDDPRAISRYVTTAHVNRIQRLDRVQKLKKKQSVVQVAARVAPKVPRPK